MTLITQRGWFHLPRSRVTRATVTPPEDGVRIFINDVEYTEYAINYTTKKIDNEAKEFYAELIGLSETQRTTDVKQDKVIRFESMGVLLFKGVLERPEYDTGEIVKIWGLGSTESYMKRKTASTTASSTAESSVNRPIYEGIAIKTIAEEQLATIPQVTLDTVDDGTELLTGSYRGEHVNVLSMVANPVIKRGGKWWSSHGTSSPFSEEIFHIAATRGSASSVKTFSVGGSEQNTNLTSNEIDFDSVANSVEVLGYGDGINQKRSIAFHATDNRTTLAVDITSSQTTIGVVDASQLPATGGAWIGMEKITYSGKTGNDLTGVTRGVSGGIDAYAHSVEIEVVDSQYTEDVPESGSNIDNDGLKQLPLEDKSIIDQDTLDRLAQEELAKRKDLVKRIVIEPSDPYDAMRTVNVGDTVTLVDADSDLNGEFRVASKELMSQTGLEKVVFHCANRRLSSTEESDEVRKLAQVQSKFMQGSTTMITVNETENAESGTTAPGPIDVFFELPQEAVAINQIKLSYRNEKPRVWNNVSDSNSDATEQVQASSTGVSVNNVNTWQDVATLSSGASAFTLVYASLHITSQGAEAEQTNFDKNVQFRINNTTDTEIYGADSWTRVLFNYKHVHEESGGGDTLDNVDSDMDSNDHSGTTAVLLIPKSTSGKTMKLQVKLASAFSPAPDGVTVTYGYQSVSTHTHDVGYDIATKTYTTTDIRIYTTDDASGTPAWTERTAAIETDIGRALNEADEEVETNINLTSFYNATTGWKGVRIVTNGNSRHKAQVNAKVFIESKDVS